MILRLQDYSLISALMNVYNRENENSVFDLQEKFIGY